MADDVPSKAVSANALICLGPRAIGPLKAHLEPTPCPTQKLIEFPRAGVCLLELGRRNKGARAFRLSLFQVTRTCTTEARASLCSCHLQREEHSSTRLKTPRNLATHECPMLQAFRACSLAIGSGVTEYHISSRLWAVP